MFISCYCDLGYKSDWIQQVGLFNHVIKLFVNMPCSQLIGYT